MDRCKYYDTVSTNSIFPVYDEACEFCVWKYFGLMKAVTNRLNSIKHIKGRTEKEKIKIYVNLSNKILKIYNNCYKTVSLHGHELYPYDFDCMMKWLSGNKIYLPEIWSTIYSQLTDPPFSKNPKFKIYPNARAFLEKRNTFMNKASFDTFHCRYY
jgi:hypothetical protein